VALQEGVPHPVQGVGYPTKAAPKPLSSNSFPE